MPCAILVPSDGQEIRQKLQNYKIDWNHRIFSLEPQADTQKNKENNQTGAIQVFCILHCDLLAWCSSAETGDLIGTLSQHSVTFWTFAVVSCGICIFPRKNRCNFDAISRLARWSRPCWTAMNGNGRRPRRRWPTLGSTRRSDADLCPTWRVQGSAKRMKSCFALCPVWYWYCFTWLSWYVSYVSYMFHAVHQGDRSPANGSAAPELRFGGDCD